MKDSAAGKTEGMPVSSGRHFFKNGYTVKTALAVATAVAVYSIFTHAQVSKVVNLSVGQMSPADIYATADFRFIDNEMADIMREKAAHGVIPVYTINQQLIDDNVSKITQFLNNLAALSKDETLPPDEKLKKAKESAAGKILDEDVAALLNAEMDKKAVESAVGLYREIAQNGIVQQDDKVRIYQEIGDRVNIMTPTTGAVETRPVNSIISLEDADEYAFWRAKEMFSRLRFIRSMVNYLANYLTVNLVYDKAKTDECKKAAREGITSDYSYVKKDQIIIRRGEEVGKKHLVQMKALADTEARSVSKEDKWYYRFGIMLVITVLMILFAYYLMQYDPRTFDDNAKLLLIALIFVAAMVLSKSVLYINERFDAVWTKYLVLVPFASILYVILVNQRMSFMLTAALSIFLGLMNANRLDYVLLGFAGGAAAIIATQGTKHRWELLRIGMTVSIVNVILLLSFQAMGEFDPHVLLYQCVSGVVSGLLCAFLAAFFIPIFEYLFNIPTDLKLLEFLDLNHPLLKEMVIEAPGTYHHSLMVGNLAEAAASAIGANPLLAKVSAYFHDVGKLLKPEYFSENEEYGKSFHQGLNPSMSSLIILSHVKDGIDLARKHKLPEVIIDILKEHHGTSLVYYFYKKAEKTAVDGDVVGEENYRYKGPSPSSKESGIVLLADAVEAASRSLDRPTPARVETLVREIISDKIQDRQLAACDLTLKEISIIADTFTRVITAAYHSRTKYPKDEEKTEPADSGTREQSENA